MISAVAFCPQAPVLVPAVAQGAAEELTELRTACRIAIRELAAPGRQLVVLGSGSENAAFSPTSRGSLAGFGLELEVALGSDAPGPVELPASLTVAAWLLRDALGPACGAVAYSVADSSGVNRFDADVGLLIMGDGTARRTVQAPGYLDERAAAYDVAIATALRNGDPAALVELDPQLGAQLLAAGVPVWRRAGQLLRGSGWQAELRYDGAPFGVGYLVAYWIARG